MTYHSLRMVGRDALAILAVTLALVWAVLG
jgi:hypothetical protein